MHSLGQSDWLIEVKHTRADEVSPVLCDIPITNRIFYFWSLWPLIRRKYCCLVVIPFAVTVREHSVQGKNNACRGVIHAPHAQASESSNVGLSPTNLSTASAVSSAISSKEIRYPNIAHLTWGCLASFATWVTKLFWGRDFVSSSRAQTAVWSCSMGYCKYFDISRETFSTQHCREILIYPVTTVTWRPRLQQWAGIPNEVSCWFCLTYYILAYVQLKVVLLE